MNQESVSIVGGFDVPFSELIEMMTDGRLSHEEFEKIMSNAQQDYHEDDTEGKESCMMDMTNGRKLDFCRVFPFL